MALGPGKYDVACSTVAEMTGITSTGGVMVIVIGGNKGHGFSVQADLKVTALLPFLLRQAADQIEADGNAWHFH